VSRPEADCDFGEAVIGRSIGSLWEPSSRGESVGGAIASQVAAFWMHSGDHLQVAVAGFTDDGGAGPARDLTITSNVEAAWNGGRPVGM